MIQKNSYFLRLCLFSCVVLLLYGCPKIQIPSSYPRTGLCNFTVVSPPAGGCFIKHQTIPPPSGQRLIKVRINVRTIYFDGTTGYTDIDNKTVDAFLPSFPVNVPDVKVANDNSPYSYEVNIQALECTECGAGQGGGTNSNPTQCPPGIIRVLPGPIGAYRGALPQWQSKEGGYNTYLSQITTKPFTQGLNVGGSCGCEVYDQ
jgi:hypothetical protein